MIQYTVTHAHSLSLFGLPLRLNQFVDDDISGTNCAVSFIRCYGEVYDVASQHGVVSDLVLVCVGESGDPGEGGREGGREGEGEGGGMIVLHTVYSVSMLWCM